MTLVKAATLKTLHGGRALVTISFFPTGQMALDVGAL
jgi:hypothetical protein